MIIDEAMKLPHHRVAEGEWNAGADPKHIREQRVV